MGGKEVYILGGKDPYGILGGQGADEVAVDTFLKNGTDADDCLDENFIDSIKEKNDDIKAREEEDKKNGFQRPANRMFVQKNPVAKVLPRGKVAPKKKAPKIAFSNKKVAPKKNGSDSDWEPSAPKKRAAPKKKKAFAKKKSVTKKAATKNKTMITKKKAAPKKKKTTTKTKATQKLATK